MEDTLRCVVVRVDARQCEVVPADACGRPLWEEEVLPAQMRGRLFEERREDRVPLAVGDRVRAVREGSELVVDAIEPRRNLFARRAAGEDARRQPLAANVDRLAVVAGFGNPPFSSITTDRILAAASFQDIPAVLVLNKTDLARRRRLEAVTATYRRAGYPVLWTSARRREGLEELAALLKDHCTVLYGLSGVGKSSLLNGLEPGLGLRTRATSRSLKSGRHTTTFARMYPLAMGGAVIDTPGVRVFRPWGLPPHELRLHFPEFREAGRRCRFPDCLHREEPGCAVLAAREAGEDFPESRYRSYLELLEELEGVYGGTGRKED